MAKVIIIGGGAAGMMAAAVASDKGHEVCLIEKNDKTGKKVYITGKGRCNITNSCDPQTFLKNVVSNSKFLYSAVYGFGPSETMEYFENIGLKLKVERGNRVFPVSEHASDVNKFLTKRITENGAEIRLNTAADAILTDENGFKAVRLANGEIIEADCCFVATGGLSYPSTGSTGDGYKFARSLGHKVTRLLPSLVSIKVNEGFVKRIEGLSLKNVVLSAFVNNRLKSSEMGEMLFTHNGISGPLVLSLSSLLADAVSQGETITLKIDLKPALDEKQLDQRILKDFQGALNKKFVNSLSGLLPSSLIPVIVELSGISPDKPVNEITRNERETLVKLLKALQLNVCGLGGFDEAVITKGGVNIHEINPSTMESKLVKGLYFIGEVLDLDAYTGGFNLQIAWSTAYAAADSI